jgi:transposase InsO family protein
MIKTLSEVHFMRISFCCRYLKVSRSGYYAWLSRPESPRDQSRKVLLFKIKTIHSVSRETYGSPRVYAVLAKEGHACSENTVAKIMQQNKLSALSKRRFKIVTTNSNHNLPIAERYYKITNTVVAEPQQVWVGDITYIPTKEGWLYLATCMDVFTRKIVGWSLQNHMRVDLIADAFKMAWGRKSTIPEALIYHSDRGSQYASYEFRDRLKSHDITPSMSRRGNCYDNAMMESFFHTLKTELVYRTTFETQEQAQREIFEYIEVWYNRQRLHSALGYLSPVEYEQQHLAS